MVKNEWEKKTPTTMSASDVRAECVCVCVRKTSWNGCFLLEQFTIYIFALLHDNNCRRSFYEY